MNKFYLFCAFLILFSTSTTIIAQHETCNGTRYITDEFVSSDTTTAILYGNNTTFAGNNQDLYMDIFEPTGDIATTRPVILLAFGGSGVSGARQDLSDLCNFYAKRGFVAVTIDYRLYDGTLFPLPSNSDWTDEVFKGVSDMKAAIRFLKEDAATTNNYRIDTNYIFVGGINFGAIIANHTAYLDASDAISTDVSLAISANGGWTGNSSSNFQHTATTNGVINYSGALIDTNCISVNESPLFSAHDDLDGTVPYTEGFITFAGFQTLFVQGSEFMHEAASIEGINNTLITIPNSTDHVSYFQNNAAVWEDSVRNTSCHFLNSIICPAPPNSFSTITEVVCGSYTSPSGNYNWSASNTYMDTIPNAAGGDSIITINLTINTVSDLSTTNSGAVISANNTGATYRWLDCDNAYTAISGESGQTYTATVNGNYAVELTENGCVDTSACVAITTVGIKESNFTEKLVVYPNITTGNTHFDFSETGHYQIVITNLEGRIVKEQEVNGNSAVIDFSAFSMGVYVYKVVGNASAISGKIIKR